MQQKGEKRSKNNTDENASNEHEHEYVEINGKERDRKLPNSTDQYRKNVKSSQIYINNTLSHLSAETETQ